MSQYLRFSVFTLLPLVVASMHIILLGPRRTRQQTIELFLVYILGISIGLNGIFSFAGHFFLSDMVATSIGWPAGNPFQLEIAFANLALGVLGILSVRSGVGFRTATAIAAAIFLFGANVVHIKDILETANYAPGNGVVQILSNFLRPVLLIGLLLAYGGSTDSKDANLVGPQIARKNQMFESDARDKWHQIVSSGLLVGGCFAVGGGIAGFASGEMALWLGTSVVLGVTVGSGLRIANIYTRGVSRP